MSLLSSGLDSELAFFLSGPLPCPYRPDQVERKLFTRLSLEKDGENGRINGTLCRAGFRRSQDIIYRPACSACDACVPVRIPVQMFLSSASIKRVAARNRDLRVDRAACAPTDELFELFIAYEKARHGDSDMARMQKDDFAAMMRAGQADTALYCLRDEANCLKGCMIADRVGDGLSAVYSFFTPREPRRSLGTALILSTIETCLKERLAFVYLGYWIADVRKMAYKARFKPLQFLGPNGWDWLDE